MQSENKYIGDDKFKKFLEHYMCPTSIGVVKMKFVGAVCSPNLNLRPTDVISSLWQEGGEPRLQTKTEAELFFKFFMGLWDEIYQKIMSGQFCLPSIKNFDVSTASLERYEQVEHGFLEGFWGGLDHLKIPAYIAEMADKLSELSEIYLTLEKKSQKGENINKTFKQTDEMVEKGISFIIEQFARPRMMPN